MFEDDLEDDEDVTEPLTIEEMADVLQEEAGLEVEVRGKDGRKTIFVLTEDPAATRDYIRNEVAEDLDLDVIVPRKTKKGGFQIQLMQQGSDDVFTVKMVKGGQHQRGRKNELGFQNFIKNELKRNGECHLHVEDNYGKTVDLDVAEVMDTANQRGKTKRSDTTLRLKDGSLYGISHKKTNACFVAKVKRVLADIRFSLEQKVRNWAKENGIEYDGRTYLSARITNREFIDLCWFGTDIAQGAAFIGDFEEMDSANVHIERIIENGDTDVLTSFPIYMVWKAVNRNFTLKTQGVCVRPMGMVVDSDLELPGINQQLLPGKRFRTGLEEPKKKKRRKTRRKSRRRVTEDLVEEDELMEEEARQNDMWDTVAYCAENHKMLWLKYETVENNEIISRKVAPYSYRTRNTKVRGRSTYFYADDFTPGQEHGIKCFLIENCLQVKESRQSFTPRWPVEIKQEIDRLERQRADDERKKAELDQGMKDDGEIVDDVPSDDVPSDDVPSDDVEKKPAKPAPKPAPSPKKNPEKEPQPKPALKKPEERPVPTKDKPEVSEPKEVVKEPEPEPKKEQPTSPEPSKEPEPDNTVNLDSDENDVQVTDDEGNIMNENYDDDSELHGSCHEWAWRNWRKGDKFFVLTEYDEEIESEALLHCGLYRNGIYIDAATQSDNLDDILENFDYGDYEEMILDRNGFRDFCIDFGLELPK